MRKVLFLMLLFLPLKAGAVDFTITLSTTNVARYAVAYNYSLTLPDGSANPEGPVAFCLRMMKRVLSDDFFTKEQGPKLQQALLQAQADALANKVNIP